MAKRSVREGSVYKYKTRTGATRWRYQVWVPSEEGSVDSIRMGEGGFLTPDEADSAMLEVLARTRRHEPVLPKSAMPTLETYSKAWLGGLVNLQSSTIQGYEKNLRNHLVPYLGSYRIDQLKPTLLNQHFKKLQSGGRKDSKDAGGALSANTIHKVGTVLSLILESAIDDNLLAVNPMRKAKLPSISKADEQLKVWNLEQIKLFLDWDKREQQDDLNALWHLMAFTGVRRGEAVALMWSDLDLIAARMQVTKATDASQSRVVKETKTKKSRRNLKLDELTVFTLKKHKTERALLGLQMVSADAWVFGGLNGQLRVPNDVTARWTRVMEKAVAHFGSDALPRVTLKGLRHTHATTLLSMNVNAKVVQERLGHSAYHVTMDIYSHVTETMQDDAVTELSRRYESA